MSYAPCTLQIDHTTPGDMKTVTVSGPSADLVQQAVTQINGLMSEASGPGAGDVSETVECPPGIVGRIIGRGGETIRGLQQASGAHIVVNQVRTFCSRSFGECQHLAGLAGVQL